MKALFVAILLLVALPRTFQDPDDEAVVTPMILGGVDALDKRYEFLVQGTKMGCLGSLVAADVVLSLAVCKELEGFEGHVFVGNNILNKTNEGSEYLAVKSDFMITHPDYNSLNWTNNLMLFKIEPSTLTPITLNNDTNEPVSGQNFTIIGFGKTESEVMSETLQKAVMQFVSNEECNVLFKIPPDDDSKEVELDFLVDDTMLCCMDVLNKSQTPCGEGGAPLFDEENGVLMGVNNGGLKGCHTNYPRAFSSVSYNLEWIYDTICNLTDTSPEFCPAKPSSTNNSTVGIIVGSVCGGILLVLAVALFWLWKKRAPASQKHKVNVSLTSSSSGKNDRSFSPEIVVERQDDISTIGEPFVKGGGISVAERDDPTVSVGMNYDYKTQFPPIPLEEGSTCDTSQSQSMMSFTANSSSIAGAKTTSTLFDDESLDRQYDEGDESLHEERIQVQAPTGKLGMVIDTSNDGVPFVHALKSDSVLAHQVKVGDALISVNGADVRKMTAPEVSRFISLKSDQPRLLVFSRSLSTSL